MHRCDTNMKKKCMQCLLITWTIFSSCWLPTFVLSVASVSKSRSHNRRLQDIEVMKVSTLFLGDYFRFFAILINVYPELNCFASYALVFMHNYYNYSIIYRKYVCAIDPCSQGDGVCQCSRLQEPAGHDRDRGLLHVCLGSYIYPSQRFQVQVSRYC